MNLGLDVSTSVVGYAISDDKKVIDAGFLKLKPKDLMECFMEVKTFLDSYIPKYDITSVTLEDFLRSFSGMRTTSNTIIKLTKINTLTEWYILQQFDRENIYRVHPSTARKHVLGKGQFRGEDTKIAVSTIVESKFKVPMKWTPKGNLSKGYDDMADAVVLSKYPYFI